MSSKLSPLFLSGLVQEGIQSIGLGVFPGPVQKHRACRIPVSRSSGPAFGMAPPGLLVDLVSTCKNCPVSTGVALLWRYKANAESPVTSVTKPSDLALIGIGLAGVRYKRFPERKPNNKAARFAKITLRLALMGFLCDSNDGCWPILLENSGVQHSAKREVLAREIWKNNQGQLGFLAFSRR
jgi:hypothetical protein